METSPSVDSLWQRFKEHGDRDARDRLVVHYSPLVKFVAGRVRSGLPPSVDQSQSSLAVGSAFASIWSPKGNVVLRFTPR